MDIYKPLSACQLLAPGCVNLSPAWFQQGHNVRPALPHVICMADQILLQMRTDRLEVSASLKSKHGEAGRLWLDRIAESASLLSAILRIIHPDMYRAGRASLQQLRVQTDEIKDGADVQPIIEKWASVFNGVSVIINRQTPFHRDNNSRAEWYDMLATIGTFQDPIMELPGIGRRFAYNSGTVVGISGRCLQHGVSESQGERLCLAYYMRDNVHERLGIPVATWMNVDKYIIRSS